MSATRLLLAGLLMLALTFPAPAAATAYANLRLGYVVDIPAGFTKQAGAGNGDGEVFRSATATLAVYGARILERDFEAAVRRRQGEIEAEGWGLATSVSTPQQASFSAVRSGRVLYVRLIALCGGTRLAAFELDYSRADLARFDPLIAALVGSLRASGGDGCNR